MIAEGEIRARLESELRQTMGRLAHAASVESLRRLRMGDDKPKGPDGISTLGVLA